MNKDNLKEYLNKEQYEACITGKNTVLIACPGSGKTRTITYRLAHFSTLYNQSQKLNIAITYTNRAADEIRNRLELMEYQSWQFQRYAVILLPRQKRRNLPEFTGKCHA